MAEVVLAIVFVPLIVGAVLWAIFQVVRRQEGYPDPKRVGAVIESELELEAIAPTIGTYHGDEIHAWVKYQGVRYDYAFVAPPRYKVKVKKDELWLAPGVVYVRHRT
jgi:hypothetical protein